MSTGTTAVHVPNKRLLIAAFVYLLWIIGFAFFNYANKKTDLYNYIDDVLVTSALATYHLLPNNLHSKSMTADDITAEQNAHITQTLSDYVHQTKVIYTYPLIKQNDKIYFTSSSATSKELALVKVLPTILMNTTLWILVLNMCLRLNSACLLNILINGAALEVFLFRNTLQMEDYI
jgi:hypothetical protein